MLPHLCTCRYKQLQRHSQTEEDSDAHYGTEDDRIPCEKCSRMHDWPHQCHECEAVLCTQCTVYEACEHCGQMHCRRCFAQHGCSPVEPRSSTEQQTAKQQQHEQEPRSSSEAQQQQQHEQEHQQQQHQQSDHKHNPTTSSPMPSITEQQKARMKSNREEAQRRRELNKRKNETVEIVTKTAKHDPFAESLDEDCLDEQPEDDSKDLHANDVKPLNLPSYAKKHEIAREKLKEVKKKADAKWQEHIRSSTRIMQLSTLPSIRDGGSSSSEGPERFEVHASHKVMAVRSVVFCTQCGYWATKKSQKLKMPCNLKPLHSDGAHKLRRMLKGLHPEAKLHTWPEGHDARVPSVPVLLNWNSKYG